MSHYHVSSRGGGCQRGVSSVCPSGVRSAQGWWLSLLFPSIGPPPCAKLKTILMSLYMTFTWNVCLWTGFLLAVTSATRERKLHALASCLAYIGDQMTLWCPLGRDFCQRSYYQTLLLSQWIFVVFSEGKLEEHSLLYCRICSHLIVRQTLHLPWRKDTGCSHV